jgi:hypothetical protein
MCRNAKEALWLVTRMGRLFNQWPGIIELRRVYCSKHLPLDGVQPLGISEAYPDGIPAEIAQPETRRLPLPPGAVSVAPSLNTAIRSLTVAKDLNRVGQPPAKVVDIPLQRAGNITQADVDREVSALRDERARQELGD